MKQVLFNLLLAFFISGGIANAATNTVHDKPLKAIPGSTDETYVWDIGTSTLKKTTFAPFLVGDCTGFPCLDGTSDGGNYIKLWAGTGSYWTALQGGSPAANRSWRLPIAAPPSAGTTYLMNMDEYGQMGFIAPSTFVASDNGTVISPRIQRVVRNVTGSTLLAGRYVYQVGASGQTPTVAYADKDIYSNSHVIGKLVGDIANNATGYMTISGGTWIGDSSAFTDGDELYLGDDGQATSTSPVAGFEVAVGHVNYANPATGRVSVDIQHPTEGGGYTNLTEFVGQTAWRLFYSDGSGDVKELTLGSDGEYLKSNGAAVAPTWATPSGAAHDAVTLGIDADAILGLSTQQITLDSQTANTVFAAPNGSTGDPTFRSLVDADIPDLAATGITVADSGNYFMGTNLEAILQEVGAYPQLTVETIPTNGAGYRVPASSWVVKFDADGDGSLVDETWWSTALGLKLDATQLDDTKGNGDSGYIWSADKVFDQLALKAPLSSPDLSAPSITGASYPASASTSTATGNINIDGVSADHYYFNNGASTATYTPVITSPPASGKERPVVLTVGGGAGVITMTWTNVSFIGTTGAATTTADKYSHYACFIPSAGNAKCKVIAEASDN